MDLKVQYCWRALCWRLDQSISVIADGLSKTVRNALFRQDLSQARRVGVDNLTQQKLGSNRDGFGDEGHA